MRKPGTQPAGKYRSILHYGKSPDRERAEIFYLDRHREKPETAQKVRDQRARQTRIGQHAVFDSVAEID